MSISSQPVFRSCPDYEDDHCKEALLSILNELGGLDWITPGMTIGIKVNLCAGRKPEAAATTHPALVSALVSLLCERGARVIVGDSPGEPFTPVVLNRIYSVCGMNRVREAGALLNDNYDHQEVSFSDGVSVQSFECCTWLSQCDAIINFCKLKSHGLMGMTAAVKNLYGIIPGTRKSEYHFMHPDPGDFANLLCDLNEYLKPRLVLVDAVQVMEGNGPTQGTPRFMGLLIGGINPYEVDRFCASLLGVDEYEIPYLAAAKKRGLLSEEDPYNTTQITAPYALKDFVRSGATSSWFLEDDKDSFGKKVLKKGLYYIMRSRPVPDSSCTGCGHCAKGCPANAIIIKNKKAHIRRSQCVRCFCCQEFCPFGAMKAERSLIAKLASGK